MDTADEVFSPPSSEATPLPIQIGEKLFLRAQPSPTAILGWISQAPGKLWFPSEHAAATGTDRDALDEPLAQLRLAGLVKIATWVRGVGQGYSLTDEGESALASSIEIPTSGKLPEVTASGDPRSIPDASIVLPERTETKSQLPFEPHSSIVVPALLIANVLWFLVGLIATIWGHYSIWTYLLGGNGDVCHRLGSVGGEDILRGEWWRLLTSCFVHGGGIHLLVNLSALAVIGPLAELLWGSRRFAVIYLFSGLGGSCLAMALHPQDSVVGASGAIWGVLMSLVVWFIAWRVKLPSDVTIDAGRRLALAIVLNAGANALPGISWQSHLGGAAVGLIAAALMHVIRFANPERRRIALGVLLALPVLSVGGLAVFMGRSEHWLAYKELVAKVHAQRIATAAGKSFDEEVIPILKQLNPRPPMSEEEALKIQFHARRGSFVYLPPLSPILHAATTELLLPGTRRNAVAVAETREKLTDLKALADSAIQLLTVPPSGVDSLDRRRELSRNFAEAQSRCFELTLQMLASPNVPTPAAWNLWGEAKRTAQSLWDQMLQKP